LIGLRCTTAGEGAGVDGVENAADTFPLAVNAGGDDAFGGEGGSGMLLRDGGVRGAPNVAAGVGDELVSARGVGNRPLDAAAVSVPAGFVASAFGTCGENFGENGGVRWPTGVDAGTFGGAAGATGAAVDDPTGRGGGGGGDDDC